MEELEKIKLENIPESVPIKNEPEDVPDLISVDEIKLENSNYNSYLNDIVGSKDVLLKTSSKLWNAGIEKLQIKKSTKRIPSSRITKIIRKRKLFNCPICRKGFPSSTVEKDHAKSHFTRKFVTCLFCGWSLDKFSGYVSHLNIHSTSSKRRATHVTKGADKSTSKTKSNDKTNYKNTEVPKSNKTKHKNKNTTCNICEKTFSTVGNLNAHLSVHTGDKPFECHICAYRCRIKDNLATHIARHNLTEQINCHVCDKKMSNANSLRSHMRTHTVDKPYKCEICPWAFSRKSSLQKHSVKHSESSNTFKCSMCPKVFNFEASIKQHLRRLHSETRSVCHICFKSCGSRNSLSKHLLMHSGDNPFQCDQCPARFMSNDTLKAHVLLHTDPDALKCHVCEKRFSDKHNLKRHLGIHTLSPKFNCDVCQKAYSQKRDAMSHAEKHISLKEFECYVCKKRFGLKDNLANHVKQHTYINKIKRTHSLFCNICKKHFISVTGWKFHMSVHEGSAPHKCEICGLAFSTNILMDNHARGHDTNSTFECNLCSYHFLSKKGLIRHKNRHHSNIPRIEHSELETKTECLKSKLGSKSYTCKDCNKSFAKLYHLKLHSTIHSGIKPYTCNVCDKKFRLHSNMRKHSKIHEGKRPYECEVCHRTFTLKENFNKHRKYGHIKTNEFKCKICNNMFKTPFSLKRHLSRHLNNDQIIIESHTLVDDTVKKEILETYDKITNSREDFKIEPEDSATVVDVQEKCISASILNEEDNQKDFLPNNSQNNVAEKHFQFALFSKNSEDLVKTTNSSEDCIKIESEDSTAILDS